MSVADYVVIALIVIFALIGLKSGLIKTVYKIFSYVASFYLAIKLSKPVAGWFKDTGVYNGIRNTIEKMMGKLNIDFSGVTDPSNAESIKESLAGTPFPDNLKGFIAETASKSTDKLANLMDNIIDGLTAVILVIICGIVLFILLRILFWLAGYLVRGIADIPIIKQVDRVSGLILGAVIGVGVVYMVGLLLTYTAAFTKLDFVYESIQEGAIAPFFYNDNILTQFFNIGKEGLS